MNYPTEIPRRYRGCVGEGVFTVLKRSAEDRMTDNVNLLPRTGQVDAPAKANTATE